MDSINDFYFNPEPEKYELFLDFDDSTYTLDDYDRIDVIRDVIGAAPLELVPPTTPDEAMDIIRNVLQAIVLVDNAPVVTYCRRTLDNAQHLRNFAVAAGNGLASKATLEAVYTAHEDFMSAVQNIIRVYGAHGWSDGDVQRLGLAGSMMFEMAIGSMTMAQMAPVQASTVRRIVRKLEAAS